MSLTGTLQTIHMQGAAPPSQPPSGDVPRPVLVTPPSPERGDPDSPFLREGRAPGTWVMVRKGTPVTAPAVKPDFAAKEAEDAAEAKAEAAAEAAEPKTALIADFLRARSEEARTERRPEARTEPDRETLEPAPKRSRGEAETSNLVAFEKIVSALKIIRGGEPAPWDGLLATA